MQFHLEDMVCDGCARSVRRAIGNVDPDAVITIDVEQHQVVVQSTQPEPAIAQALSNAGFPPS